MFMRVSVLLVIFVLVGSLVGGLTYWGMGRQFESDAATVRQLRATGEHLEARVASRETFYDRTAKSTRYVLHLEATRATGARFTASDDVDQSEYAASAEGTVVPLVVDRDDAGSWRRESYMALTDATGHGPGEAEGRIWAGGCVGSMLGFIVAGLVFRGMRRV